MERVTRMQLWKDMDGGLTEKEAELAGSYDMPWSPSDKRKDAKPGGEKATIDKTAEADPPVEYASDVYPGTEHTHSEGMREKLKELSGKGVMPEKTGAALTEDDILKMAFGSDNKPDDNEEQTIKDENIEKQPQPKTLKPTVDVTSHEPPKLVTEKKASRYALPSQGRYPLDGYDQVKQASAYFDEWHKRMNPEMRREYCQNMVKRAHELGIEVSALAECYGSDKYATAGQLEMALDARRSVLHSAMDPLHKLAAPRNDDVAVLDKLAEEQPRLLPDTFARALGEFDRITGLDQFYDGDIPDPYVSTFMKTAESQTSQGDPKASIIVGNEYLTERDLVTFGRLGRDVVKARFGEELAEAFAKDPKGIFNSLPRDQKLVLMRMASSVDAQHQSASKS